MKAVVYSRENCQWCDRVKYLLDHLKINYIEYVYEKDFTKDQFYDEFGVGATSVSYTHLTLPTNREV